MHLPTLRLRPLNHSANQTEKKITIEIQVPVKPIDYLILNRYLTSTQIMTLIDDPIEKQLQTEIETLKQRLVSYFLSKRDYLVLTSNEKRNNGVIEMPIQKHSFFGNSNSHSSMESN